ncbi:hypothetical protein TNCV_3085501 [Trichonephila clavipes]|nr:hypothetical protein TNCV_3085501 [Trichonephila clavipes]
MCIPVRDWCVFLYVIGAGYGILQSLDKTWVSGSIAPKTTRSHNVECFRLLGYLRELVYRGVVATKDLVARPHAVCISADTALLRLVHSSIPQQTQA